MHTVILAATLRDARAASWKVAEGGEWIYPTTPDALDGIIVRAVVRVDGWLRSPYLNIEAMRRLPADAWEIETLTARQAQLATDGVKLEQSMLARERDRRLRRVVQVAPEQVAASTEYAAPVKKPWWRRG